MNDREELIKLVQRSVGGCARFWAERIADNLIANGVRICPLGCDLKERLEDDGK